MRRTAPFLFVLALLTPSLPAAAVPLSFTGTVRLVLGDTPYQTTLSWQATGVADLQGTTLSFAQTVPLLSEQVSPHSPAPLSVRNLTHASAQSARIGAGTLDLSTLGLAGLALQLQELHVGVTMHYLTPPTLSYTSFLVEATHVGDLRIAAVAIGASPVSVPGTYQFSSFTEFGDQWFPPSLDVTLTAGAWSVATAAVGPGGGVLQLVTPVRVNPSFANQLYPGENLLSVELVFVPEPSTGLLLGLGTLALALRGRRRLRRPGRSFAQPD